jgi:predicted nucleotidyltransferase
MGLNSIRLRSVQIEQFCNKYHILRLAFFGSVVRDDFGPYSDLDVLVEFEPGHIPGFDFFLMEVELSRLLDCKVDLQTENFLSPDIRQSVLSEAITAYEHT